MSNIIVNGNTNAPILVICGAPSFSSFKSKSALSKEAFSLFGNIVSEYGFGRDDFCFMTACAPMGEDVKAVNKKKKEHMQRDREEFLSVLKGIDYKCVFILGADSLAQYYGANKKLAEHTNKFSECIHNEKAIKFTATHPNAILRFPANETSFKSGVAWLGEVVDNNYIYGEKIEADYKWCTDLTELLDDKPSLLSVDTETTGLLFYKPEVTTLTVQLTRKEGESFVCPINQWFWDFGGSTREQNNKIANLKKQLNQLLGDKSIDKIAHNINYDDKMLRKSGIEVKGWRDDTMLMAAIVDENMKSKNLDDCVKRWVPAMSGYADNVTKEMKKDMVNLDKETFLYYAGGDADATFRLHKRLLPLLNEDKKGEYLYRNIKLPATSMMFRSLESYGIKVDEEYFSEIGTFLKGKLKEHYALAIEDVPTKVLQKYANSKTGLNLGSAAFVRDILFSKDGFNFKPKLFTETTKNLKDEKERVPKTDQKQLAYFVHNSFVEKYLDYTNIKTKIKNAIGNSPKSITTLKHNSTIHPSYSLAHTITGRVNSMDPNGQNFPKRGLYTKEYRRSFIPREGYTFVSADLSQAELRLIAWEANDPTMIDIYRNNKDIHRETAIAMLGIREEEFVLLPEDIQKKTRTHAKPCIAENEKVLTDKGLIAIQNVTLEHKVWDGIDWVSHEGVVCKGVKEVIYYAGLWATPDHEVYTSNTKKEKFAKVKYDAGFIVVGETRGKPVSVEERKNFSMSSNIRPSCTKDKKVRVYDIVNAGPRNRFTVSGKLVANCNFGAVYGIYPKSLTIQAKSTYGVDMTEAEAESHLNAFFSKYRRLRAWQEKKVEFVRRHGYHVSLLGKKRRVPSILSEEFGIKSAAERDAINSSIQGDSSDIALKAAVRITRDMPFELARPIMFIHDDNIFEVRDDFVEEFCPAFKWYMSDTEWMWDEFGLDAPIPFSSDVQVGKSLGDMEEKEVEAIKPEWFGSNRNTSFIETLN